MKIELYYDKECPFCNSYANYIKLKEEHELKLINARNTSLDLLKSRAFDINDGFVIVIDNNEIYQGSEAILYLNKLSHKKIFFKDNFLFKKILYPFIKFVRIILLRILGKKTKI